MSPLQGDLTIGSNYDFVYSAPNEYASTLFYWDSNNNNCSNNGVTEYPSQGGAYNFTETVTAPPSGFCNVLYVYMATNSTTYNGPFYIGYNIQTNISTKITVNYKSFNFKPPKIPEIDKYFNGRN